MPAALPEKAPWITYRPELKVLDCTIRDGGLVNAHQFSDAFVRAVYDGCVAAGVDYMEIGYKNSKQTFPVSKFGPWRHCDEADLQRVVGDHDSTATGLKLAVMADAGKSDWKTDLVAAADSPLDMIRVAFYAHQVSEAVAMIRHAAELGYETTANLMAVSNITETEIDVVLAAVADTPASTMVIVDSFGHLYREQIDQLYHKYSAALAGTGKEVGIHAHNNMQLAFANTIEAIILGCNRVDATMFGFGRGAGNCHTELLLGFLRAMIDGPTPLHMIEKPTPGTGATLLVDAVATIQTGSGAAVTTEGRDDEEWRKRITAKLRQIPAIVLIDNLRHELDSSALAAALTAPYWEDRILGVSEMTRLPIRAVWIATGNNPTFSNEMARRIVRIRLDARVDQPWRRDGFRHADLMGWVRANRARLVAACLTLCQAWIAAGRPRGSQSLGSYDAWAQTMGGVLEVAGIEGFLGNLDEMLEAADGESAVWRSFVGSWWDRFGTAEVGTADLFELCRASDQPLPLGTGNDRSQRIRLGKTLARLRDRVFRLAWIAVRISAGDTYQGAQRWRLVHDENIGTEQHSQHSPTPADSASTPADPVNVVNVGECWDSNIHEPNSLNGNGFRGVGECCECFSHPYVRAGARSRARETRDTHSPRSRHSRDPANPRDYAGECAGECRDAHSPPAGEPAWLEDVP